MRKVKIKSIKSKYKRIAHKKDEIKLTIKEYLLLLAITENKGKEFDNIKDKLKKTIKKNCNIII